MALTQEQQIRIIEVIQQKLNGRLLTCPVSNDSNWEVNSHFGQILATQDLTPDSDPSSFLSYMFPNVVIICNGCGYTMFFNLYRLGVAEEFGIRPDVSTSVPV